MSVQKFFKQNPYVQVSPRGNDKRERIMFIGVYMHFKTKIQTIQVVYYRTKEQDGVFSSLLPIYNLFVLHLPITLINVNIFNLSPSLSLCLCRPTITDCRFVVKIFLNCELYYSSFQYPSSQSLPYFDSLLLCLRYLLGHCFFVPVVESRTNFIDYITEYGRSWYIVRG